MKTILSVSAVMFAVCGMVQGAPRLTISTPSLAPNSEVDVVFDKPMVAEDQLGKEVDNKLVDIKPAMTGKLFWKAPTIAELRFDKGPALGAEYRFSVGKDLKHLDGSLVGGGEFAKVATEDLTIHVANIQNRWSSDYSPEIGSWVVVFNDDVELKSVESFIGFQSGTNQKVGATVRHAMAGEVGYYRTEYVTWANRKDPAKQREDVTADTVLKNIIIVSPKTALPVGSEWQVVYKKGLPNAAKTGALKDDLAYVVGNIEPFKATSVWGQVSVNQPRSIVVSFNRKFADSFDDSLITVSPKPKGMEIEVNGKQVTILGDFDDNNNFTVSVSSKIEGMGGVRLTNGGNFPVQFERLEPELALPTEDEGQFANGQRKYEISTINLSKVHIRVKKIDSEGSVRAIQGYRNYTGRGPNYSQVEPISLIPYALVQGETVVDKEILLENPVDSSKNLEFNWDELLPEGSKYATLFVDVVGTPHAKAGEKRSRGVQAIVQLTDIGLAWKFTGKEALVFAFSCETGKPLNDVKLGVYGEDAKLMAEAVTDANGIAKLPRSDDARHLRAVLGDDSYAAAYDETLDTVGMWYFPVRYSWMQPLARERKVFLFTERSIYRPGEKVRIKGIVRDLVGNDIEKSKSEPARIVIKNPREKEIYTEDVIVTKHGSFDLEYVLPDAETGEHVITLQFPDDLRKAAETEDWELQYSLEANASFSIPLNVEEFRRNTFEIVQSIDAPQAGASEVKAKLTATYYQGQPVAAGKAAVFTEVTDVNPYPERFQDFLFGNHRIEDWRYWYHYFGYRDRDNDESVTSTSFDSEQTLTQEGFAEILVNVPAADFPVGKLVRVSTEVTDANDQTLTARTEATVHPASVYAGISRNDKLVRVGEEGEFRFVAVTPEGEPVGADVKMTVEMTRQVHATTKTTNTNGDTVTESEPVEQSVFEKEVIVTSADSAKEGMRFAFTPEASGVHFLTLRGVDAEGKAFATVTRFHVYGAKEYPWQYEDGMRIKLVSEKKSYKPGDVARVLVLSPIEGKALVTVEREKVLSYFVTDITLDNPVIEIPLDDAHAPNAYVSVLIVKGSAESARDVKEPQLRLGYCELTVENLRDRLQVSIDKPEESYRPGTEVVLAGNVKSADGKVMAGAEVTFYAVDEGTLAVMGYDTPNPMGYFYEPRSLSVEAGTSFHRFLTENTEYRSFWNKGFFIGGGGDLSKLADLFRKNFDPCAAWAPSLETDAEGNFSYRFTLPATLTKYRLIAVAHEGGARFGHGESSLVVNKPLMLEPKLPRFTNQGDKVVTQVMVQNVSGDAGTWDVSCITGEETGSSRVVLEGSPKQVVELENGGSTVVTFPIKINDTGDITISYQAKPLTLSGRELTDELKTSLSDSVQETFESHYPMPLLRQVESIKIKANSGMDLRDMLSDNLKDATGNVELDMSISPLVEMGSSVEYLLQYPYGCAEQTSSSLMPWFAVKNLRPYVSAFASKSDGEIQRAIRGGVSRLLSMQLTNGSFGYWPGEQETNVWVTPYAGMALVLASKNGGDVPASALDSLAEYLITSLRGAGETNSSAELGNHAYALYTLALLDKAQPSYHALLVEKMQYLSPTSRGMLASAIAMGAKGDAKQLKIARDVMQSKVVFQPMKDDSYWVPGYPEMATELIAWLEIDPMGKQVDGLVDRMIHDRNPYGHWNSTWMNGWNLMAISNYAASRKEVARAVTFIVETDAGEEQFVLSGEKPSANFSLPLGSATSMKVRASSDAFLRLKVAGKPPLVPSVPVATNGLQIERIYERVLPNGQVEILTKAKKGDLVRVTLRVTLPNDRSNYLVIDDPLPSIFETVNSKFASQASAQEIQTSQNEWRISHSELRTDRAVFFLDYVWNKGTYNITYLARCTIAGDATAPPAKVEMMYEPQNFALSASDEFSSQ
jgi:alpha-2-macroglobulin